MALKRGDRIEAYGKPWLVTWSEYDFGGLIGRCVFARRTESFDSLSPPYGPEEPIQAERCRPVSKPSPRLHGGNHDAV